jgi:hypothetical protein
MHLEQPGRKFTVLGHLASEVGWKHADTVKAFEVKRIEEGKAYFNEKLTNEAVKSAELNRDVDEELAQYGY